ncbi:hypothetical protein BDZ89DRAFT_1046588 [Hymenopellis radicata]|nr:hypothetical protein BDZ89DRAFT_1046588 [Hymenopellis radicata]
MSFGEVTSVLERYLLYATHESLFHVLGGFNLNVVVVLDDGKCLLILRPTELLSLATETTLPKGGITFLVENVFDGKADLDSRTNVDSRRSYYRNAMRLWIVNVGDMKPYEREIEFFLNYHDATLSRGARHKLFAAALLKRLHDGWDASAWNPDNLNTFVTSWAQREFALSDENALAVTDIIANQTRFNVRKKPELFNSTTYSLVYYREAETVMAAWDTRLDAANAVYNGLGDEYNLSSFFQLVLHPVTASANLGKMYIAAGLNNLRSSEAFLSTNALADRVQDLLDIDYELETQYHTLLDGKRDQYRLFLLAETQMNSLPAVRQVQAKKQAVAGVMRIAPEGTPGACSLSAGRETTPVSVTKNTTVPLPRFFSTPSTYLAHDSSTSDPEVLRLLPWLSITPTKGSIFPDAPEQRIFASVADWDTLPKSDSLDGFCLVWIFSHRDGFLSVKAARSFQSNTHAREMVKSRPEHRRAHQFS